MSKVGVIKKEHSVLDLFKRIFGSDGNLEDQIKTDEQACQFYGINVMQLKELKNTGRVADLEIQCSGIPTTEPKKRKESKKVYKVLDSKERPREDNKGKEIIR